MDGHKNNNFLIEKQRLKIISFYFYLPIMSHRSRSTIICARQHTLSLSENGNVFSFGNSTCGCLGYEIQNPKLNGLPKSIPSLENIKSIAAGEHCVCLDYCGNVYTFGDNEFGQLGIGLDKNTLPFTYIPQKVNLPPCTHISCGEYFTMCLLEDGSVYSFGYNFYGQLGIGNNEESYNSPQLIPSLKDVEFIECGGNHIFCKTLNNEIFCWGFNGNGQLGLGNKDNVYSPNRFSDLQKEEIVDIKCGYTFTLLLTYKQEVFSCGHHSCTLSGIDSLTFNKISDMSDITRIECGYFHSMCIDGNSNLFVFGLNRYGQLGLGDTENRISPTKHPLSNIIDISSNGYCTFAKTISNEIYAFGRNDYSQTGIKTEDRIIVNPIQVFQNNEDIWRSNINKSKAKSARF